MGFPNQPGPYGTEVNVWQKDPIDGTLFFGPAPERWNVEQIPGTTSPRDDERSRPNWPDGRPRITIDRDDDSAPPTGDPGVSGDKDTWHGGDLQPDGHIRQRYDDATGKWINIDANGNDIGIANRQDTPSPGKPSSDDADKDTWHGGDLQPDGKIRQRYDDATGKWINIDAAGNDIGIANVQDTPASTTPKPDSGVSGDKDTWHGGDLQPDGKIRQRYDAATGTWINVDAAGNDIGIANKQPAPAPKPEPIPKPIPKPTPAKPTPGPKPSVDDFSKGGVFDPKPGLGNVEGIPKPIPSVDDFSRGGRFADHGDVEGIPRPKKTKPIHKDNNDDPVKRMKKLAGVS